MVDTKPNTLQRTPIPTQWKLSQTHYVPDCAKPTYLPTQKLDVICGRPLGLVPIIVLGLCSFLHNVLGLVAIVLGLVSTVMCWV